MKTRLVILMLTTVAALACASGQTPGDPALAGDWRGDSICVVRPSACHDEKALYRIKKTGNAPNQYSIDADKIVDGKPVFMGTFECTFAADKHLLTCTRPNLTLTLALDGKSLNGTMNLPDGTLWRNITLHR